MHSHLAVPITLVLIFFPSITFSNPEHDKKLDVLTQQIQARLKNLNKQQNEIDQLEMKNCDHYLEQQEKRQEEENGNALIVKQMIAAEKGTLWPDDRVLYKKINLKRALRKKRSVRVTQIDSDGKKHHIYIEASQLQALIDANRTVPSECL